MLALRRFRGEALLNLPGEFKGAVVIAAANRSFELSYKSARVVWFGWGFVASLCGVRT